MCCRQWITVISFTNLLCAAHPIDFDSQTSFQKSIQVWLCGTVSRVHGIMDLMFEIPLSAYPNTQETNLCICRILSLTRCISEATDQALARLTDLLLHSSRDSVVICVQIIPRKITHFTAKSSCCILDGGDDTEMFLQKNKNTSILSPRLTPKWNGGIHSYSCPPYGKAGKCCLYHFIFGPFRRKDQNDFKLQDCPYKEKILEVLQLIK
jgi:hypothetical protein